MTKTRRKSPPHHNLVFVLGILIGMAINRVYPAPFLPPNIRFVEGTGIGFEGLLICATALVHFRKASTSPCPMLRTAP